MNMLMNNELIGITIVVVIIITISVRRWYRQIRPTTVTLSVFLRKTS